MTITIIMRYIDLFCGVGSFHEVLQKRGHVCVGACDSDTHAREVYKLWHGFEPSGKIEDMDAKTLPEYDMVTAGFPCQPFSQAGRGKGFEDKRGTMFEEVMRFAERDSCKVVILENVSSLLSHNGGATFATIKERLEGVGYTVSHNVLKASDYGIPQMRKRLFIVCTRNGVPKVDMQLPHVPTPTLSECLGKHFDEKDVAYTIRCGGRRSGLHDRHNWDTYLVNGLPYVLTPEDCLILQGFTRTQCKDWKGTNSQKYMRMGNTIPTCLVEAVMKGLQTSLDAQVEI